jgi:putative membrane protein
MKPVTTAVGAILITFAAGQAMAQLAPADRTFAEKAASGGKAEVALGRLAQSNAASPRVRAFGERMVTDHSQANAALEEIARRQHLDLPAGLDASDRETEQRLRSLRGEAFDTAYMRDMVDDHKNDIADFEREAQNGQDRELRAFAQKYLPVLHQHLEMAESDEPARSGPGR